MEKIITKDLQQIETPQVFFNSMGFLEDNLLTEEVINNLFLSR